VWNQTTEVSGDTSLVPIIDAPPTPTAAPLPQINIGFYNMINCSGAPRIIFSVTNASDERLRSIQISIRNLDGGYWMFDATIINFPFFFNPNSCDDGSEYLDEGETGYIGAFIGIPVPHGDDAQLNIRFCHERDLGGTCADYRLNFVVP
jgi:hypothetical protein